MQGRSALVGAQFSGSGGAAWAFERSEEGTWRETTRLSFPRAQRDDFIGHSVALSPSLAYGFVGAPGTGTGSSDVTGAAYAFDLSNVFVSSSAPKAPGSLLSTVSLAPSPTRDAATLTFRTAHAVHVRAALYNALGRQVAVLFDGYAQGERSIRVDTQALPAGLYVCHITTEDQTRTMMLVIAR